MNDFVITTDSGCDLSGEYLGKLGVEVCRISYMLGEEKVPDPMEEDFTRSFYQLMREGKTPKTSQLNTYELYEFWKAFMPRDILHISLGSGISGTYNNALAAKDMLQEEYPDVRVIVIDSLLASVGYGMLAITASRMKESGAGIEEIAEKLEDEKHHINTWYTTGDLTYLYRSGRVSRVGAAVGTMLHINPILNLDDQGKLIVRNRVRGKKAAVRAIYEAVSALCEAPETQTLYICHSDVPEEAKELGEGLKNEFGFKDVFYTYIGPSIGAHCGPGLMAAFFEGKPRTR